MWMASSLMYTSDMMQVLLTFGVVRFASFTVVSKSTSVVLSLSVYCFQSCQSKYYNCDGLNVVFGLYGGLDI